MLCCRAASANRGAYDLALVVDRAEVVGSAHGSQASYRSEIAGCAVRCRWCPQIRGRPGKFDHLAVIVDRLHLGSDAAALRADLRDLVVTRRDGGQRHKISRDAYWSAYHDTRRT